MGWDLAGEMDGPSLQLSPRRSSGERGKMGFGGNAKMHPMRDCNRALRPDKTVIEKRRGASGPPVSLVGCLTLASQA